MKCTVPEVITLSVVGDQNVVGTARQLLIFLLTTMLLYHHRFCSTAQHYSLLSDCREWHEK